MQVSIRRSLLVALVALVVVPTGLLLAVARSGQSRLERGLALPIVEGQALRAERRALDLIEPIRGELAEAVLLIQRGQLRSHDREGAKALLLHGFQQLRGVGSMMVGDELGYQLLFIRFDESVASSPLLAGVEGVPPTVPGDTRFITREFDRPAWGDHSRWTLWDPAGETVLARWEVDLPGYQVTERPWHQRALGRLARLEAAGGDPEPEEALAWTDVYTMFTSKESGLSASIAVRGPDGDVVVVAYDVLLSDLTAFTSAQRPTPNGVVFLCDEVGRAVALPYLEGPSGAEGTLPPLGELGAPGLTGWVANALGPDRLDVGLFDYIEDGERWWGLRTPFELSSGARLWIGVAIPDADVMALTGHDPDRVLAVAALALAAALVIGLWLSSRISTPLAVLAAESERIGRLDLSAPTRGIDSRLREVRTLGLALESMRSALADHVGARERAVAQLAASETRFRDTFEQAAVGIVHETPDGQPILVNQRMSEILGRSSQELLTTHPSELTHPDDREAARARRERMLAGGTAVMSWEERLLHKDGREVWAEVTSALQRDAEGRPRSFVTVVQDVSERKRLEEHLLQSQKLEAVGRLAGGVAHDFNNLLTVIRGYTEMVRASLPTGDRVQDDLRQVEAAADSATALTRQLLAFARREASSARIVDVCEEVRANTGMLERLLGEKIELTMRLDGGPFPVAIDPVHLQQVLVNLAVNARDSMPKGGPLSISVAPEPGGVAVHVVDRGEGMSPEVLAHAFDPFYTTKPVGQGTGLGLATCYGIIEQAGGSIDLSSRPGDGTTVTLHLPAATGALSAPVAEPERTPREDAGTLLIVEDEAQIREMSARALEERGYRVLTAPNGESALELHAAAGPIDLVVTDVVMPGMNGGELAARLRARVPGQRVLFVSGYAESAFDGGLPDSAHLLAKPYTTTTLLERIRDVLEGP